MKTDERDRLDRVGKLLEIQRELQAKLHDLNVEMQTLCTGGVGIGALLKDLEHAFDTVWCARYGPGRTRGYDVRYVWAYAKDVPQLKRLLKMLDSEEIKRRMARYVASDEPFYIKARHPFALFVSSINSFAEAAKPQDFALSSPVGCKHAPACASDAEHTRRRTDDMRSSDSPF